MLRKIFSYFTLPLLLLLSNSSGNSAPQSQAGPEEQAGILEKMIVGTGNVVVSLDLDRLNGGTASNKEANPQALRFDVGANSFFTILVLNNALRGPEVGSMGLIAKNSATLRGSLKASLEQIVLEKVSSGERFDFVIRDEKTPVVLFNVEGQSYDYDAATHTFSIRDGRLLISEDFAKQLERPSLAGAVVGKISIATTVYPIEVTKVVNGEARSVVMPPPPRTAGAGSPPEVPNFVNGPDVIVGDLPAMVQSGSSGSQVGLAVATTSCNNGNVELNWFQLPNTDHPVIPQNLYRMSGGASNNDRFEQIGQSWLKHAFTALQQNACGFGCTSSGTGTRLGVGCSDPYDTGLNGSQTGVGSRAWVNPFTGVYPVHGQTTTPATLIRAARIESWWSRRPEHDAKSGRDLLR